MARPYNKNTPSTVKATTEKFEEVLDIKEPNERSTELAKLELTEAQKDTAEIAARRDFLNGGVDVSEEVVVEEPKPNKRAEKLLAELEGKNISVNYPSDFSKWDEATYQRLEKLNK